MDKLVKDIELIVANNLTGNLFEDVSSSQRIALSLSSALADYKRRRYSESFETGRVVSCRQWRDISELVDFASGFWHILPHNDSSYTYNDYYRLGFVNAVLRIMRILDIDEDLVKK